MKLNSSFEIETRKANNCKNRKVFFYFMAKKRKLSEQSCISRWHCKSQKPICILKQPQHSTFEVRRKRNIIHQMKRNLNINKCNGKFSIKFGIWIYAIEWMNECVFVYVLYGIETEMIISKQIAAIS